MKEQAKKSPAVHAEISGSGKKLVQARLPFKIISSPVAAPKLATPVSESRKRKLSSEGDVSGPRKVLCTSEIKENLGDCKTDPVVVLSDDDPGEPATDGETSPNSMNPVVKLSKIDNLIKDLTDEDGKIMLSPKTPKILRDFDRDRRPDSPTSSKVSTTGTKLHIKLPISEKKKRKLSQKFNSSFESESDVELIPAEITPGKKAKSLTGQQGALDTASLHEKNLDDEKSEESFPDSAGKSSLEQKTLGENKSETSSPDTKENLSQKGDTEIPEKVDLTEESSQEDKILSDNKSEDPSPVPTENPTQNEPNTINPQNKDDRKDSDKLEVSIIITDDEDSLQPESDKDLYTEEAQKLAESSTEDPQSEDESVLIDDDSDADISSIKSSQPGKSENESAKGEAPSKTSEENVSKILTPKQRKRNEMKQERLKQKEAERLAKQKEKEEKLRSRQKEKEEKEEQKRKEKEEKDEQKRKEKEEKEEQKRKEKEEKEKKRLAELEAKNEERRQKEEEKRLKEEERRKKEEDKKKKEEEVENKKRRAAEAFSKFFVQSKAPPKDGENEENSSDGPKVQNSKFVPFQVKRDMKLAPICRKCLDDASKLNLEEILQRKGGEVPVQDLYLNCLKTGKIIPGKDSRTLPACSLEEESPTDCIIVVDELEGAGLEIDEANKPIQKYRAKFLYFHENQRPPYYGTWRKKSDSVKPRRPLAQDKILFDYEVDSDDEWEEEDPGESLHGSDDEKESEDEYDVDNEFMVPHGHLSDEELQNEDETDDNSPEMQKEKLKILQAEFAREMKKKTEKIKPRIVGIVWQDENGNRPEMCSSGMWESLNKRAMIFTAPPVLEAPEKPERESVTPEKKQLSKAAKLTEEHIKTLVQLVHGNRHKKEFMIKEFQAFVSKETPETEEPLKFKKSSIREQIEKIAAWKVVVMDEMKKKKRLCWMVAPDVLKNYDLESLSVVNKWQYTLQPKRVLEETENTETVPPKELELTTAVKEDVKSLKKKKKKKPHPAITMFTTVVKEVGKSKIALNVTNSVDLTLENDQQKNTWKSLQLKEKSEEVLKTIPDNTNTSIKSPISSSKPSTTPPAQKKRVALLMSVPRGQAISQERKTALISESLKKQPEIEKDSTSSSKDTRPVTSTNIPVASSKPSTNFPSNQTTPPQKKRVALLMSVPRGQAIPQEKKSVLISEFLKKRPETDKDPPGTKEISAPPTPMEVETITLD